MNLIYQVYLGEEKKLYNHCTKSVKEYAKKIGAHYEILTAPKLKITPNVFRTDRRDKTGGWKKLGYMAIFEKENVFDYFKDYKKCCVIDSDIFIRPTAPNIFNQISSETVASVYECDLPMEDAYAQKIKAYSTSIWSNYSKYDWEWNNRTGGAFFNSGVMLYNSEKMLEALNGMNPRQFLEQSILADFVDGVGPLKWQSDQMTLNYWFKVKGIPVKKLDWKWNALYTAVDDIKEAHFVHFFLKDKLPNGGENVEKLMEEINEN